MTNGFGSFKPSTTTLRSAMTGLAVAVGRKPRVYHAPVPGTTAESEESPGLPPTATAAPESGVAVRATVTIATTGTAGGKTCEIPVPAA
jgi:hypothetical protein